jgi:enoyl-CoA hydratase/carnithine racemase
MLNSMDIKTATLNGVATIEIARPHKKNALTAEMYSAMAAALRAADADTAVRALLMVGDSLLSASSAQIAPSRRCRCFGGASEPTLQA